MHVHVHIHKQHCRLPGHLRASMRASYVYVYIDISRSTWKALAPTHMRTHTYARVFHTYIHYTCAIRDRTRDCANGEHSYKPFHADTYNAPISTWRWYVHTACTRVRPSVNCTLHACARALVHRERLSACVRVYVSDARRILDIVQIHTIIASRRVRVFSSFIPPNVFPRCIFESFSNRSSALSIVALACCSKREDFYRRTKEMRGNFKIVLWFAVFFPCFFDLWTSMINVVEWIKVSIKEFYISLRARHCEQICGERDDT